MVTINHELVNNERLNISRNIHLECVRTVLAVLPNINGIGVTRIGAMDGLTDELKEGVITVVEIDTDELTEREIEAISHLGVDLSSGVSVERLNLDMDDIRCLQRLL